MDISVSFLSTVWFFCRDSSFGVILLTKYTKEFPLAAVLRSVISCSLPEAMELFQRVSFVLLPWCHKLRSFFAARTARKSLRLVSVGFKVCLLSHLNQARFPPELLKGLIHVDCSHVNLHTSPGLAHFSCLGAQLSVTREPVLSHKYQNQFCKLKLNKVEIFCGILDFRAGDILCGGIRVKSLKSCGRT